MCMSTLSPDSSLTGCHAGFGAAVRAVLVHLHAHALHRIAAMDVCRRHLLGKGNLFGVRHIQQPDGYVAVMPYPACLHHATSCPLPTQLLRLGALRCDTLAVASSKVACWDGRMCACRHTYESSGGVAPVRQ